MKLLLLDIESSPITAHVWGLWQQNVQLNQIRDTGGVLCWSAKWFGDKEIHTGSLFVDGKKKMLKKVHELLDEADGVIHFNGKRFDIPVLYKEFLLAGMPPPSPFKHVDLLLVARSQFKFPSNKLAFLAQQLGIGEKTHHKGHELWVEVMQDNPKAWATMLKYNRQDVRLTEALYKKLLPWIRQHPNHGIYSSQGHCCPNCGSTRMQARGNAVTLVNSYKRFQCQECGTWSRSPISHTTTKERRELLRPVVA